MKIIVLNGSPKGQVSVTMQYVRYLQQQFPEHTLEIIDIAQKIKFLEKDETLLQDVFNRIKTADGVLWAFPVYVFLVSSQYKRFIELIWEKEAVDVFTAKYTAVLSTSIHFYDHTAHNYLNAICDDLGMKYVGSFSADMQDLLNERTRGHLLSFARNFFEAIQLQIPTSISYPHLTPPQFAYSPGTTGDNIHLEGKKLVLLTDSQDAGTNLGKMIDKFTNSFNQAIEVINLNNLDIKGGCLGCLRCGYDNTCLYQGKDEFIQVYETKLKTADIIVFAGTIQDRYLSSRWKMFFDRAFYNNHVPSLRGKQLGVIISGPLSQIPNLRQILEAYAEWQKANLVGIVTDEGEVSPEIDALLYNLGRKLIKFAGEGYIRPVTFLGVGGIKLFRDEIWGRIRFVFQADHRYYKANNLYDFPQKDYPSRIRNAIFTLITKIPAIRKQIFSNRLNHDMIKPFQKIVGAKDYRG